MAPEGQYVFAEVRRVTSEDFTAKSHECLPYSVIPTFSKQINKLQPIGLPIKPINTFENIVESKSDVLPISNPRKLTNCFSHLEKICKGDRIIVSQSLSTHIRKAGQP